MITVLSYNILFYLWIVYIMLGSVLMYDYGTILQYTVLYLWIVYIMLGSVLMYDYGTILQHTVLFVDSLYNAGFCVDV